MAGAACTSTRHARGQLGCVRVACGVGVREFYIFHFLLFLSFTNINTIK
jgi:hypothetical protein